MLLTDVCNDVLISFFEMLEPHDAFLLGATCHEINNIFSKVHVRLLKHINVDIIGDKLSITKLSGKNFEHRSYSDEWYAMNSKFDRSILEGVKTIRQINVIGAKFTEARCQRFFNFFMSMKQLRIRNLYFQTCSFFPELSPEVFGNVLLSIGARSIRIMEFSHNDDMFLHKIIPYCEERATAIEYNHKGPVCITIRQLWGLARYVDKGTKTIEWQNPDFASVEYYRYDSENYKNNMLRWEVTRGLFPDSLIQLDEHFISEDSNELVV